MNKTKNLIIIALAVVIIIGAVGIGVGVYMNRPETVMQTSVQSLFEDVFAREELETVSALLQSGSLEVIMSLSGDGNEVSLEYKEYFGLENYETYIEKLKLTANDFSIDGSAYVGEDYLYVSVPSLYDSPVGLSRGNTEKEFDSSLFVFESGSEYEFDEEMSDSIKILCRIYDDAQDKAAVEDIKELLTSYVELLMNSIRENADIEKENDKVKIHGESVNARVITVEIDAECIYNIADDLYKELKDDGRIPKLIKKYGKLAEKYVEGTVLEGELQQHLGEDEDDDFVDVLLEAYDDMLDDLGNALDEMEESLEDADDVKIVVEMATKKSSSDLLALNVTAKADGEKMEIVDIQFGKDGIKKTDKITVEIMQEMTAEFAIKQDDKDGYKAEFIIEEGEEEILNVFAKIDKSAGKFSFGATVEGETYEIKGGYEKSGKKHTFDFKDVVYTDYSGETFSLIDELLAETGDVSIDFDLKVIICENEKPKPLAKSKVKSAFELDEDDFEDLQLAVEELVAEAQSAFGLSESSTESVAPYESGGYGW